MDEQNIELTVNGEETTEEKQLPTYSEDGVDLTLIRWMLLLTPLERLRTAQNYANSALRLRNAPRRVRL
jgi:hypothetical protein